MPGPLEGIRVFDLTLWLVGPWASMQLGSLGAEVIHIEQPDVAWEELGVRVPPTIHGMPHGFIAWNTNKKQVFLNLKSEDGHTAATEIIKTCDVFITNMKAGVATRLGLGYDTLAGLNPRLVYVSVTGWGESGPQSRKMANDIGMQYFTGFGSQNGPPGGEPEISRHFTYMDGGTGNFAAQAALLGLAARERTGRGQMIELSMMQAMASLQTTRMAEFLASGEVAPPRGSASMATAPDEAFACKDGQIIGVSVADEGEWSRLCAAIDRPELRDDQRFATNRERVSHREELSVILSAWFRKRPQRHWILRLSKAGVPLGYPMRFQELHNHRQVVENGHLRELASDAWGSHYVGGPPWTFSRTPAAMTAAGVPGQDTAEVLGQFEPAAAARG